jgi:hypothetical protein
LQNLNFELASPECSFAIDFWGKYSLKMSLLPMVLLPLFASSMFQIRDKIRGKMSLKSTFFPVFSHLTSVFVVLCSTLYTFLVSSAIEPFNCIRTDGGSANPIYFMVSSPLHRCYDAEWYQHLPGVLLACFVYVLGIPFAMGFLLFRHRKNLDDPNFLTRYRALFRPFRRIYFFWELVVMLKKASFIVIVRVLSSRPNTSYGTKFVSSISIIGTFLAIEVLAQPYSKRSINLRSSTWNIVSVLVLLCQGLLFESLDGDEAGAFGILVTMMVITCLLITTVKLVSSLLRRNVENTILLPENVGRKMPRDLLFEVYMLNTLTQIEENNELWIYLDTWRKTMTRSEFDNLMLVVSGEHQERLDTNLLSVGHEGGDQYCQMLKEYLTYHMNSPGML